MILIDENLQPNDLDLVTFIFLFLLVQGKIHPSSYEYDLYNPYLKLLEEFKYIKLDDGKVVILDKSKQLFDRELRTDEQKFLEIFTTYPIKTPGGRILRCKSTDAKEFKVLLEKYISKVVRKGKHDIVVRALNNELKYMKMNGGTEYMPQLITWINQEKWDRYIDMEDILVTEKSNYSKDV